MFFWMKKLLPLVFLLSLSGFTPNGIIKSGGEIPWPLSKQRVVTVSNSVGLWMLSNQDEEKIFNVEMVSDPRSGFDWIRVAEMDPKTLEVLTWGEGFFGQEPIALNGNSYFDITVEPGQSKDKLGRYLSMFPNGNLKKETYMIRLVEVKTSLGSVLGLSVLDHLGKEFKHYLGQRIMKEPLHCSEESSEFDVLTCHLEIYK